MFKPNWGRPLSIDKIYVSLPYSEFSSTEKMNFNGEADQTLSDRCSWLHRVLESLYMNGEIVTECHKFGSSDYYSHFTLQGGIEVFFNPKRKKRIKIGDEFVTVRMNDGTYAEKNKALFDYVDSEYSIKLVFNPNKVDDYIGLKQFVTYVRKLCGQLYWDMIKINRLDVAVDYKKVLYLRHFTSSHDRGNIFFSKSRGVQTLNLGAARSDFKFTLYNKRDEQLETEKYDCGHNWFRIECKITRDKKYIISDWEDDFKSLVYAALYDYDLSGVPTKDLTTLNLMIRALKVDHSNLHEVSGDFPLRKTFNKYKKLLESLTKKTGFVHPSTYFTRHFKEEWALLKAKLDMALMDDYIEPPDINPATLDTRGL